MIKATLDNAEFIQEFGTILSKTRHPRGMLAAVGRQAGNDLRKHFRGKDRSEPNRLGGTRQHFWLAIGRSVQAPIVDEAGNSVSISITHPAIAQKVFGGRITAKRVRNLAIPQTPEAYGRAPSVFERETGFKLIFIKQRENILLARKLGTGLQVEYLLTPSVHQDPDPTALPNPNDLEQSLLSRAESMLERELEGNNES